MHKNPTPTSLEALLTERSWLRSLSLSLVGASDADDLVQEATLVALERQADAEHLAAPRSWLAGVTFRLAMARRRRGAHRRGHETRYVEDARADGRLDDSRSADELLAQAELENEVVAELLKLPEAQRATLLLRFQGGHTAAEIARRTDTPDGTVRRRMKTGLDELRARMDERHGGGRELWAPALVGLPKAAWPVLQAAGGKGAAGATVLGMKAQSALVVLALGLVVGLTWVARDLWNGGGEEAPSGQGELGQIIHVAAAESGSGLARAQAAKDESAVPVQESAREELSAPAEPLGQPAAAGVLPAIRYRLKTAEGTPVDIAGAAFSFEDGAVDLEVKGAGLVQLRSDAPGASDALGKETASLVVKRADGWPAAFEVPVDLGERELTWPAGKTVGGWFTVDGSVPAEPVEFTAVRDVGWAGEPEIQRLSQPGLPFRVELRSDAEGRFEIVELPADWRGWIQVDRRWCFGDGGRRSEIFRSETAGELRLALRLAPRIVGRLVSADGSESTANVAIGVTERIEGVRNSIFSTTTGADGRFEWAPGASAQFLDVQAGYDGRFRPQALKKVAVPERGAVDLGDIAVETAPLVTLRLEDGEGQPVPGATVHESILGPLRESEADEEGLVRMRIRAEGEAVVKVSAPGFERSTHTLTAASLTKEEVTLVLRPSLRIEITVRGEDGDALPGAEVAIQLSESVAADTGEASRWQSALRRGDQTSFGERINGPRRVMVKADASGVIEYDGLPNDLQAYCGFQDERTWDWIDPPVLIQAGEDGAWRVTLVDRRARPWQLSGRIVGPDEQAIEGASVSMGRSNLARSDADGRFSIEVDPDQKRGVIEVMAAGFGMEVVALDLASSDLPALEIQLGYERELSVALRAGGASAADAQVSVWCETDGAGRRRLTSREIAVGGDARLISGLPEGPLELRAEAGGVTYRRLVASDEEQVTWALEPAGQLTVRWGSLGEEAYGMGLRYPRPDGLFSDGVWEPSLSAHGWEFSEEEREAKERTVSWAPGRYELFAASQGKVLSRQVVEIRAGETTAVELR